MDGEQLTNKLNRALFLLLAIVLAAELLLTTHAQSGNSGQVTFTIGNDPCASSGIAKSNVLANISTATTTGLVPVSGSTVVYVCGVDAEITSTATPATLLFEQGTGAACASSPVAISATYTNGSGTTDVASVPLHLGHAGTTWIKTAASNGLCAVTTVGTGPAIAVTVTYVQQ